MYMDILGSISGIEIYPIVSLGLFVAFFSGVLGWAVRADGRRLAQLAAIPLDEDDLGGRTTPENAHEIGRRTV